ncbi:MAG: polysaccharide biosynthesis C-terminal domain-containing protein [Pseudomonadota bacterium]
MIAAFRLSGITRLKTLLVHDAFFTFAIRVGSAAFAYLIHVLLARLLSVEEYGVYAGLWVWIVVAAHMAVFGFSESALRFLPRYMARGHAGLALGFLGTGFRVVALGSVGFACVGLGLIWLLQPVVPPAYLVGLVIVTIGLPFAAGELYMEGVCRSFGWFGLAIVPGYLIRPVFIGLAVGVWAWSGHTPDAGFVLIVAIVATGFLMCVQAWLVRRRLARQVGAVEATSRTGLWLRATLPLMFVNGAEEMFVASDVLILGLLGTPDEVALYFAAVRSMALVNFIAYAFMIVSPRKFSIANARKDPVALQAAVSETTWWTFWLTIPAVLLTLSAGYPLLMLFGPDFVAAYPVMAVIALGYVARASVGTGTDLLVVLGHQRASLAVSGVALVTNVILSLALYPVLGILGVAAATSAALAVRAAATVCAVRRCADLDVFLVPLRRPARADAPKAEPYPSPYPMSMEAQQ